MEGLWMGNKAISMTDERFYQLTFRLVIARYGYVTYCSATFVGKTFR